eukprot:s267_g7.t1
MLLMPPCAWKVTGTKNRSSDGGSGWGWTLQGFLPGEHLTAEICYRNLSLPWARARKLADRAGSHRTWSWHDGHDTENAAAAIPLRHQKWPVASACSVREGLQHEPQSKKEGF